MNFTDSLWHLSAPKLHTSIYSEVAYVYTLRIPVNDRVGGFA